MLQERHVESRANGILLVRIEDDLAAIVALLQCSEDIFRVITPVTMTGYMASPRPGLTGRQRPEGVMRLARISTRVRVNSRLGVRLRVRIEVGTPFHSKTKSQGKDRSLRNSIREFHGDF